MGLLTGLPARLAAWPDGPCRAPVSVGRHERNDLFLGPRSPAPGRGNKPGRASARREVGAIAGPCDAQRVRAVDDAGRGQRGHGSLGGPGSIGRGEERDEPDGGGDDEGRVGAAGRAAGGGDREGGHRGSRDGAAVRDGRGPVGALAPEADVCVWHGRLVAGGRSHGGEPQLHAGGADEDSQGHPRGRRVPERAPIPGSVRAAGARRLCRGGVDQWGLRHIREGRSAHGGRQGYPLRGHRGPFRGAGMDGGAAARRESSGEGAGWDYDGHQGGPGDSGHRRAAVPLRAALGGAQLREWELSWECGVGCSVGTAKEGLGGWCWAVVGGQSGGGCDGSCGSCGGEG